MRLDKVIWFGAAGLLGALAYWKRDSIIATLDQLVIRLAGKRVAVLGERHVGKTVLLKFLADGEIPSEYMQTLLPENVAGKRLAFGDLKLDLKGTRDLPGGHDAITEWKKLHDEADYVLYLVNAQRVDPRRITRDLTQLEGWSNARKSPPKLAVIVTHMDLNPAYVQTPPSAMGDFRDRFVKMNLDAGLSKLSSRPPVLLGSLADKTQATKLVTSLIGALTQ